MVDARPVFACWFRPSVRFQDDRTAEETITKMSSVDDTRVQQSNGIPRSIDTNVFGDDRGHDDGRGR